MVDDDGVSRFLSGNLKWIFDLFRHNVWYYLLHHDDHVRTEPLHKIKNMSPTTSATRWTSTLFQFLEGNSAFGVQYEQLTIVLIVLSSILYNTASGSYWTINIKCDSWCDATLFGIGYTVFFMKLFVVAAFTIDYILRIYTADIIDPVKYGGFLGRLRFMITFLALVDFFSIVPFYIGVFVMPNAEMGASTFLRMLRLLRMAHAKQPNKIITIPPVPSSLSERTQSHFIAGSTFRAAPALVDGFDRAQQHPHVREGGVARVRFQSRFIPEIYSTMLHATKTITRSENFSAGRTSSAPSRGIDGIGKSYYDIQHACKPQILLRSLKLPVTFYCLYSYSTAA